MRQVAYVRTTGDATASAGAAGPATGAAPALPGTPGLASRERTSRVLAIVVDDYSMSFESTVYVRRMLERHLERVSRRATSWAILRSSGGNGALRQFTTDRRLLAKAVERIRWGARVFPLVDEGARGPRERPSADELLGNIAVTSSLEALDYAVRGLEPLPGRKAVVFVSEAAGLGTFSDASRDVLARCGAWSCEPTAPAS